MDRIKRREWSKRWRLWLRKFIPSLPMRKIMCDDYCICDNEILPFKEDSTHSIIIRRHVGQFGHHPACYLHHENMFKSLGGTDEL